MKIIEQQFECMFCGVKTTGRFESEIDEEQIEQNKKWEEEYKIASNEYLKLNHNYCNKILEYGKIVNTHNECEEKHRHFWEPKKEWHVYQSHTDRWHGIIGCISIGGTDKYPTIDEPEQPKQKSYNMTKYITCPVCGQKHYFL